MARVLIGNFKGPKGDTGEKGPKGDTGPQGPKGATGAVDASTKIAYTTPTTYSAPASGDTIATLFGKITKGLADLFTAVGKKLDTSKVVNNLTTTAEGYALDARQGKVLNDAVGELNSKTIPDTTPVKNDSVINITNERNGIWYFISAANGASDLPDGTWGIVKYDKIANGLIFVTYIVGDTGRIMTAVYNNGWSNWR